jgi:hypothetical protein
MTAANRRRRVMFEVGEWVVKMGKVAKLPLQDHGLCNDDT